MQLLPSILFPFYPSNQLTFGLDLLHVCVGHYHGLRGLRLKVTGQGQGPMRLV